MSSSLAAAILHYSSAIHIPIIVGSNSLVLITFAHVSALNTPDNYAIAALATSDLLIGTVFIPINLVHFGNEELFNISRFICMLDFPFRYFLLGLSISFLMLLTLDRYTAIAFPYFYNTTQTNSMVVWAACGLCVFNFFLFLGFSSYIVETYLPVKKNGMITCEVKLFPDWFLLLATVLVSIQVLISMLATIGVSKHACRALKLRSEVQKRLDLAERTIKMEKQLRMTIIMNFLFMVLVVPSIAGKWVARNLLDENRTQIIVAICNHLLLLNSSLNAGVYAMSRPIYRSSFVYILNHSPWNWGDLSHDVLRAESLKGLATSLVTNSSMVTRTPSTMNVYVKTPSSQKLNKPDEIENLLALPEKQRSTSVDTGSTLTDTIKLKLEKRSEKVILDMRKNEKRSQGSVKRKSEFVCDKSSDKNKLALPEKNRSTSVDTGKKLTDTRIPTTTTETTKNSSSTRSRKFTDDSK